MLLSPFLALNQRGRSKEEMEVEEEEEEDELDMVVYHIIYSSQPATQHCCIQAYL